MSSQPKRGRPVSESSGDLDKDRRRVAARLRKQRSRQLAAERAEAANRPMTRVQRLQADDVVSHLPFPEPAVTPVDCGIRTDGADLGVDPGEEEVRRDAVEVRSPVPTRPSSPVAQSGSGFRRDATSSVPNRSACPSTVPLPSTPSTLAYRPAPFASRARPTATDDFPEHLPSGDNPFPGLEDPFDHPSPPADRPPSISSDDEFPDVADLLRAPRRVHSPPDRPTRVSSHNELPDSATLPRGPRSISQSLPAPSTPHSSRRPHLPRGTLPSNPILIDDDPPARPASVHDIDDLDSSDDAADPVFFVAEKLAEQLYSGFHGCTDDAHREKSINHTTRSVRQRSYCNSIASVASSPEFPDLLRKDELLTPAELTTTGPPSPACWEETFCGIRLGRPPQEICLSCTSNRVDHADIAYDVDSFLGFASSLALAKKGIFWQAAPQFRQNIRTDVHIRLDVPQPAGPAATPEDEPTPPTVQAEQLQNIPHFLMGRVAGIEGVSVYFLFPEVEPGHTNPSALTHEQQRLWYDQIFSPAIRQFHPPHHTQHLPGNFDHAYAISMAKQREDRVRDTQSYQAQQATEYFLGPDHLEALWEDILVRIQATPATRIFSGVQIFLSAKGTKLQYKSSAHTPTLLATLLRFVEKITGAFDFAYIYEDRFFVDIGKEICSSLREALARSPDALSHASVLLWRRCCLESYMKWLYDDAPPSQTGDGQRYYTTSLLRDAVNLTSMTPRAARYRRGGLVYSQFYNSSKELLDANKTYPFQGDGQEELAVDPVILKAANRVARAKRDAHIIQHAFIYSKRRLFQSLNSSRFRSFGLREEHRISWKLLRCLINYLRRLTPHQLLSTTPIPGHTSLNQAPRYAFSLRTSVYIDFLYRQANKFVAGYEIARAATDRNFVTFEQTKVMAMFLRCLRFGLGGYQLNREPALWFDTREVVKDGKRLTRIGLGFQKTLAKYGYAWLKPRVDWTRLTFNEDVRDHMLFGGKFLKDRYLKHARSAHKVFDVDRMLDLAIDGLVRLAGSPTAQKELLFYLSTLCLQRMRTFMLEAMKRDIRLEQQRSALEALEPWSLRYMSSIVKEGQMSILRPRHDRQPEAIGEYLFGTGRSECGTRPPHWESAHFRTFFQRCGTRIEAACDKDMRASFEVYVMRNLWIYHRIIPNPCSSSIAENNGSNRKRNFYAIGPAPEAPAVPFRSPRHWIRINEDQAYALQEEPLPFFSSFMWDEAGLKERIERRVNNLAARRLTSAE